MQRRAIQPLLTSVLLSRGWPITRLAAANTMVTEVAPEHTENKEGGCCTLMSNVFEDKREEMGEGCGGCMAIKINKKCGSYHSMRRRIREGST